MAVISLTNIARFIGTSNDIKPLSNVKNGSTFLETDTGNLYSFDGTNWFLKEEFEGHVRDLYVCYLQSEILEELKQMNEYLFSILEALN